MGPFESSGTEWATPEYDAAGNMISGPRPGAETTALHYVYDAWNRMVKVTDASDETVAEYQYDGLNRRVVKLLWNASSETWNRTDYYYNEEWQVLEERGAVGVSTVDKGEVATDASVQYLWDPKYIDSPILRWRNANTGNADLEEVLYYTTDGNMNVTALVDTSGAAVERYLYAAYGTATVLEPDGSPKSSNASGVANETGYSGYRKDPETGLWYVRMRYLQPTLATWNTRDPVGTADGMNLYAYVGNDPPEAVDPYGRDRIETELFTDVEGKQKAKVWYIDTDDTPYLVLKKILTLGMASRGEATPVLVGIMNADLGGPEFGIVTLPNGSITTLERVREESEAWGTNWEKFQAGDRAFDQDQQPNGAWGRQTQAYVWGKIDEGSRKWNEVSLSPKAAPTPTRAQRLNDIVDETDMQIHMLWTCFDFYATAPLALAAQVATVRQFRDAAYLTRYSTVRGEAATWRVSAQSMAHILERHGANSTSGASRFYADVNIRQLIARAELAQNVARKESYGGKTVNMVLDAGHTIGWDAKARSGTRMYTVVTNMTDTGVDVISAYPGLPAKP